MQYRLNDMKLIGKLCQITEVFRIIQVSDYRGSTVVYFHFEFEYRNYFCI